MSKSLYSNLVVRHTPGNEWEVTYDGFGCHVSFRGGYVYDTTLENPLSLVNVAELEANARLIEAAPKLFEALLLAKKWIEFAKQNCNLGAVAGGDWYIDQDTIRDVIRKIDSTQD
jgi:hypothetical protein